MKTERRRAIISAMMFMVAGTSGCAADKISSAQSAGVSQDAAAVAQQHADGFIQDVTSITKVFADGQKVAAIAIKYSRPIAGASLAPSDFTVKTAHGGQRITALYATTDGAYFTRTNGSGPYVVLELSTDYVIPAKTSPAPAPGGGPRGGPGGHEPPPPAFDLTMNPEVVTQVGNISWNPALHPDTLISKADGGAGMDASVTQVASIGATDGTVIPANYSVKNAQYVRNLIVDGFLKADYHETDHSGIKYNIHFPRDYDPSKKYPLVVFLIDSTDAGTTHASALVPGLGGVIWADQDAMAGQQAIIVVPSVKIALLNKHYQPAPDERRGAPGQPAPQGVSYPYLSLLHLMNSLISTVPGIDRNRIYATGQGDGAATAIKLMIDEPNMFAGGLMFAPDYDPAQLAKLSKANLWIVSAQADIASYPDMKIGVARLKLAGAKIDTAVWNGQDDATQLAADVDSMAHKAGTIKFTVLRQGTVVPSGMADDQANIHAGTWRIGYSIPGLRNWLLSQSK